MDELREKGIRAEDASNRVGYRDEPVNICVDEFRRINEMNNININNNNNNTSSSANKHAAEYE